MPVSTMLTSTQLIIRSSTKGRISTAPKLFSGSDFYPNWRKILLQSVLFAISLSHVFFRNYLLPCGAGEERGELLPFPSTTPRTTRGSTQAVMTSHRDGKD